MLKYMIFDACIENLSKKQNSMFISYYDVLIITHFNKLKAYILNYYNQYYHN